MAQGEEEERVSLGFAELGERERRDVQPGTCSWSTNRCTEVIKRQSVLFLLSLCPALLCHPQTVPSFLRSRNPPEKREQKENSRINTMMQRLALEVFLEWTFSHVIVLECDVTIGGESTGEDSDVSKYGFEGFIENV